MDFPRPVPRRLEDDAMNREGPDTIMQQYQSCLGCRHHEQHMRVSGRNPVYDHYCKHPGSPKGFTAILFPGAAWIGDSDHTPGWCPILNPAPDAGRTA